MLFILIRVFVASILNRKSTIENHKSGDETLG